MIKTHTMANKSIGLKGGQNKGFLGDFLGNISGGLGSIAGGALGSLIGQPGLGATIGGGLGSALSSPLRGLPFKKGGVVKKGKKKPAHMVKGSVAARKHMKKIRMMKK